MYDFLIVGAGIFGSVCARELYDRGYKCLVIDKRDHVGGNCYTEEVDGIAIHKYGGHIFHTDNKRIWDYINKYSGLNLFLNRVKACYKNKIYSFPINLMTLYQLWGVTTPEEAREKLEITKCDIQNPNNLEEWILSQVGEQIYKIFFYGYTKKQWGREPRDLPIDIIKRVPIRLNFDDTYLRGKFQGIPLGGYTTLFHNLLWGSDIKLKTSWDEVKDERYLYNNVIFTGPIDEFFNYKFGKLEYRSLSFEEEKINIKDFQGNAVINYTDENVSYTRILEHKHFEPIDVDHTIITKEYPQDKGDPFYPINDKKNNDLYKLYLNYAKRYKNIIYFGGRLGSYKYMDMDEAVLGAINLVKEICMEGTL